MNEKGPATKDNGAGSSAPVTGCSSFARRSCHAFTLVELLTAAAITAAMAGFIVFIVHNVSTTWTRETGRLGADAQARIVLDQLELDLQGAMFRDDGNVWMAADLNNNNGPSGLWDNSDANAALVKPSGSLSGDPAASRTGLTVPGNLADARYGQAGVWLRFFTSNRPVTNLSGTITTPSAPVAVGYQLIRRFSATNLANRNHAYLLHRAEVRPVATGTGSSARLGVLDYGFNITAAAYSTGAGTRNNDGTVTGDPKGIQTPGTNGGSAGGTRNLDSVIADNVIDFGIRAYVQDASQPGGLRLVFPATAAGALTNSPQAMRVQLPSNTPTTAPNYNFRFLRPDVIDVMIRVLTDEGARQISALETGQFGTTAPTKYNGLGGNAQQQWWWGVAQENSRVYMRRIVLNAKSL